MERVVLRHRAYCRSCASKLPPRTEVWWDAGTDEVTCLTCYRLDAARPAEPPVTWADGGPPASTGGVEDAGSPTWWEPAPVADPVEARPDAVPAAVQPGVDLPPQVVERLRTLVERPGPGVPGYAPAAEPVPDRPRRSEPVADPANAPVTATGAVAGAAPGTDPVASPTGRIAATLDAAVDQGLLTLHHRRVPGSGTVVDHLVVAPNGLWVVADLPAPEGKVERRDVGDWFSSDPRLYVADEDRSADVHHTRDLVEAVGDALAGTPVESVPRRGVVCFADAPVGWFANPFILDEVSVTWRMKLVEPMVSSVLYVPAIRAELATYLDTVFTAA